MTVRFALPTLLLFCLLPACAAPDGSPTAPAPTVLRCQRKGFAITYAAPDGWTGPVYAGGPALDSWTFSNGPPEAPDSLETRIYDAKDAPLRYDTASDAAILADFRQTYRNPRVERVATIPVDGHRTVVRAVHSVGIDEYLANVYFGDSLVSVMCTSDTPAKLARHRTAFLAFLRSLRFEKEKAP